MQNRALKLQLMSGIIGTIVATVICLFFSTACAGIVLVLGAGLTILYFHETVRRYRKLSELNTYLSLVCSGHYDMQIGENTEGELSILQNNLYKVIVLLRTQNETLKKDKIFLADALADISHQLKTPLTSMMVMTDLLKEEENQQKRCEFVSIIETQLEKMRWLLANLLKFSKLDAGTVELKRDVISLNKVIEESLKPFLLTIDLKNLILKTEMADTMIKGDFNWTVEAVSNVIKNCMEHLPEGGCLTITARSTSIYDAILIQDTGVGIAPEDLPHIFERFYHGKNASKDSVGIGLALAKTILHKEHGEIMVSSEPGVGTTFEIRFYKAIV